MVELKLAAAAIEHGSEGNGDGEFTDGAAVAVPEAFARAFNAAREEVEKSKKSNNNNNNNNNSGNGKAGAMTKPWNQPVSWEICGT